MILTQAARRQNRRDPGLPTRRHRGQNRNPPAVALQGVSSMV